MDWIEKGKEAAYLGALALFGTWVTKKAKPFSKQVVKLSNLSDRVDKLEIELRATVAKLETRIAVEENMVRAMLDNSKTAAFTMDKDFELNYVNSAWLERLGFTNDEEAFGIGFLKAIPEAYMEKMERQMRNSKEHPGRFSEKVCFKHLKTGEEFWMFCMSTPIYDYKDSVHGTLGFLYEID